LKEALADFAVAVAVAVVFAFVVALPLLGPHKAVAVEPAGIARRAAGMDARRVARAYATPRWRNESRLRKQAGRAGGVCFLLVTFLCTSKEK